MSEIESDILGAYDFKRSIKEEFLHRCMLKNERKIADANKVLNEWVFGKGDSFSLLVKSKNLSKSEGDEIISEIRNDILKGLIQADTIDGIFLTKRFNEYNERK